VGASAPTVTYTASPLIDTMLVSAHKVVWENGVLVLIHICNYDFIIVFLTL